MVYYNWFDWAFGPFSCIFFFLEDFMKTSFIIIIAILVFLIALIIFAVAPSLGNKAMRKAFYKRNIAHRGLHSKDRLIPENSMAAFAAAVEAGYGIEFDIQLTKDEQVVVFHDDDLRRVCGDEHRVDYYTYEELQKLRLSGTDERIPLFSDFLKLVDGKVPFICELKTGPKNALLCEKAYAMLKEYKGDFCIESFNPLIVKWFRKHAPEILRGQLSGPTRDFVDGGLNRATAFMLSNCLMNFFGRPQFIAYNTRKLSVTVRLAELLGAMKVVWTVRPGNLIQELEKKNDCIIFEFYRPDTHY